MKRYLYGKTDNIQNITDNSRNTKVRYYNVKNVFLNGILEETTRAFKYDQD